MQDGVEETQGPPEESGDRPEETRPTPARDGAPAAEGGQGSSAPEYEVTETEEDRRPTPVRVVMDGGDEEDSKEEDQARVIQEEEGGKEWTVTVSGRSASGILPLRTVPLLELSFAHAGSPDQPLRKALRHGVTLSEVTDQELLESLRESTPFREPMQTPETPEKRGRKNRNRRPPKS